MSLKLILRPNWVQNVLIGIAFIIILSCIYSLVSTGYVCPVISRVDDITIVNRCTSDFGPRLDGSLQEWHKGVDINRGSGIQGDKIRNIHEETVIIDQVVARNNSAGNYIRTNRSGNPNIYVRYLHMRNNYPNESDANRWVFLDDAQLGDGSTADIIVQYQNGSISKVWGAVAIAGKTYGGVSISTTLTSAEIFGRVGDTGAAGSPHLHIDINNEPSTSTTHPPFAYIPRAAQNPANDINLTYIGASPALKVLVKSTLTYNIDSLSDSNMEMDLDFERATLEVSRNQITWTVVDSGFRVRNLDRTPSNNKFYENNGGPARMKSISHGSDDIYLYWTPGQNDYGTWYIRCRTYHSNNDAGTLMKERITQVNVST